MLSRSQRGEKEMFCLLLVGHHYLHTRHQCWDHLIDCFLHCQSQAIYVLSDRAWTPNWAERIDRSRLQVESLYFLSSAVNVLVCTREDTG